MKCIIFSNFSQWCFFQEDKIFYRIFLQFDEDIRLSRSHAGGSVEHIIVIARVHFVLQTGLDFTSLQQILTDWDDTPFIYLLEKGDFIPTSNKWNLVQAGQWSGTPLNNLK